MTALPREVSWDPPAAGAFTRTFRFGEWISEPVTPLFESWLLAGMENRLHALLDELLGERASAAIPRHRERLVLLLAQLALPVVFLRNMPRTLLHAIRSPRGADLFPATVRYAVPLLERQWREDLQPRYRAAVAAAEPVETLPITQLPSLIDKLAILAGEYFTSIAALAGGAFKIEIMLAGFYRRHLAGSVGGHLPLVAGLAPPADVGPHAVVSLDWWYPPAPSPKRRHRLRSSMQQWSRHGGRQRRPRSERSRDQLDACAHSRSCSPTPRTLRPCVRSRYRG